MIISKFWNFKLIFQCRFKKKLCNNYSKRNIPDISTSLKFKITPKCLINCNTASVLCFHKNGVIGPLGGGFKLIARRGPIPDWSELRTPPRREKIKTCPKNLQ